MIQPTFGVDSRHPRMLDNTWLIWASSTLTARIRFRSCQIDTLRYVAQYLQNELCAAVARFRSRSCHLLHKKMWLDWARSMLTARFRFRSGQIAAGKDVAQYLQDELSAAVSVSGSGLESHNPPSPTSGAVTTSGQSELVLWQCKFHGVSTSPTAVRRSL